jgi:beta-phosphoglucomutase-like phosphatase (HAD superfamily)
VPDTRPVITLSPRDYDAILFDLDGVLTKTARVHAAAWKRLFDQFLEQRSAETGEPFVPFDVDDDYRRHVDGRPRQDGVAAFLQSRRIDLPLGAPDDGPAVRTVHGLGSLKDQYFLEELNQQGVERYEASIERHCQVNVDRGHVGRYRDAECVRPLPRSSTQRTRANAEVADGQHGADVVQP